LPENAWRAAQSAGLTTDQLRTSAAAIDDTSQLATRLPLWPPVAPLAADEDLPAAKMLHVPSEMEVQAWVCSAPRVVWVLEGMRGCSGSTSGGSVLAHRWRFLSGSAVGIWMVARRAADREDVGWVGSERTVVRLPEGCGE